MIANMSNGVRGFTLIEVMIVVAIIGILAAIAYPSYRDQLIKSRRAEGKASLVEAAQALEKCKILYGRYNAQDAGGNNLCNAHDWLAGANPPESANGFYVIRQNLVGDISATTFFLRADPQPPQTDPACGTLKLRQNGERCVNIGGGDLCGNNVPDGCW